MGSSIDIILEKLSIKPLLKDRNFCIYKINIYFLIIK